MRNKVTDSLIKIDEQTWRLTELLSVIELAYGKLDSEIVAMDNAEDPVLKRGAERHALEALPKISNSFYLCIELLEQAIKTVDEAVQEGMGGTKDSEEKSEEKPQEAQAGTGIAADIAPLLDQMDDQKQESLLNYARYLLAKK